ncbi:phage holin family protein [Actinopolymorpha sp. NPDC004070]|uniref:phage holin family protein n=1 Tax=Actinopolymorpha sp. NPDC004070 TaxID=3154548 RepID=UPI0033BC177E
MATHHDTMPGSQSSASASDERSLGQLVADASRDLSTLLRGEIELAKVELKESATAAGKGAGMFGGAAFFGYVAFLMLSIAAGYGLVAAGLHPAIAFVVVGVVYLIIAGILALIGKRNMKKAGPPERTKRSIDETKTMLQQVGHHDQNSAGRPQLGSSTR